MEVEVISFNDWKILKSQVDRYQVVVTVSRSTDWGVGLSPFKLGPCALWGDNISATMENAWQFSKVYPEYTNNEVVNMDLWLAWAKKGWADTRAHRYPVGKGRKPLYSYWDGEQYGYIEARKKIYIPLYWNAVRVVPAFRQLLTRYNELKSQNKDLYLVDFDAYRHKRMGYSYRDVINDERMTMGHAFVLAMALEEAPELDEII